MIGEIILAILDALATMILLIEANWAWKVWHGWDIGVILALLFATCFLLMSMAHITQALVVHAESTPKRGKHAKEC